MADEKIEIVIPKIKSPEEYENPTELYEKLIAMIKKYHPSDEISLIEKAYKLADDAHKEQKRRSGEPYIIHPLSVAIILAEFELDKETIIAGILHDVVEDTVFTLEEITEMFGAEVALLVDGVTKLTQVSYSADKIEIQAENLRKMFLAMGKDIRVILIKLADRLHNMRTMEYQSPAKQVEKSRETMDIYAPIADRLGISKIKVELDDLALKYLEPDKFADIAYQRNVKLSSGELMIKNLVIEVDNLMKDAGIKSRVYGRMKHIFSIYKKMINQNKEFDQILDLFAVRIIVDSVKDCYAALGIIHEHYKPIQGRFKDYIAMPKSNMYQSLHTTLIGPNGQPFEIQIRTEEMHKTAENGIAAHWKYKEDPNGKHTPDKEEEKLSWLREILEWQNNLSDNKEFLSVIKSDFNLFTEDVYCFTPSGDVKNLPNGSTPIDFAYSIHSAVGNKMVGARVNGKIVNIDYKIQNGDRIEIITSQNSKGPSRDWLNIVKSSQAKNKINQWFKSEFKEDNIVKGRELIERYCKMKGVNISDLTKHEFVAKVLAKYNLKEWNAVLAAIGHGSIKEGHVINRLIEEYEKKNKKPLTNEQILEEIAEIAKTKKMVAKSRGGIVVKGVHDVSVRFSKCCNPVPGDEIVGFITRGRGISIHRTDCVNVMNLQESERVRLMEADWQEEREKGEKYLVEIQIFCNNRTGLLADISKIFTERNIDVQSMNSRTSKQEIATISMSFMIGGKDELNKLVDKIRMVDSVLDIVRASY
ncbi:MAG: bifunctional (p)ppGpp synthetase/guanosine-3',5'-bis(diphosphate) 3'-pyrophosphohydrolase [Lachnospiraceae bacterium]|nr:bifunctional (p)ppGpp synthetase/guanosine-3',5'-bis(diphosphate) 3'-pyrophosphohydrolase [Lachnospiraceae bacterium]MEE0685511.1 bifunctional (p)ppGpp synthetase/guanosine-3',5'-bis(diphosphate) 3'-pyrophosphohydrolase [Lachnospiraceae bacterium]